MNEQFENLMYQSGLTAQGCWDNMDSYDRQSIEKFAQLIVRECANMVDTNVVSHPHSSFGEMLKRHFGVEQ